MAHRREIASQTCGTCDWWCYGTYPSNTCDRWERTVWECEVPDDVIAKVLHEPTSEDMEALARDVERMALDGGRED